MLVPDRYDDGGISGATLERPALKRLLADIEEHRVDVVVVYKIDRLSRALMDFSKLVEVFDRNNVTFVSVTQSFNTTTSMGRLTLNILLSFAQFEREVIGERIRDKFAASRKKGMWMGGFVPLGYDVKDRKLVVNEAEAETVRRIFEKFTKTGSVTKLVRALRDEGVRGKRGRLIDKSYVYQLFRNRAYIGEAVHKGVSYPGEHKAIVSKAALGQGLCRPQSTARDDARRATTGPDASVAERPYLRPDRLRHDADAHAQGRAALSLLHRDRSAEARCAGMHRATRAGGRDRRRGGRSGPRPPAFPGNDRAHVARGQAPRRRPRRVRGPRRPAAARPSLERAVPGRAGARRAAAGRASRRQPGRRRNPTEDGRTGEPDGASWMRSGRSRRAA